MAFALVLSTFYVMMEWRSSTDESAGLPLLSPVFVESEFTGDTENAAQSIENQPQIEKEEEVVYEDYNPVDKIAEIEELPEIMQLKTDLDSIIHSMDIERNTPELSKQIHFAQEQGVSAQPEEMPQFPGGMKELIRYIYQNIRYPEAALKQRIQGRVWCSFIVNTDGSISDVRLEQGVYIFLDEEAVRVLKTMPAWNPGLKAGKKMKVKTYVPIVFKL
ncbi:MAG: energy transducer TonB [Dysgonamonadaceae bacterium]|nr:energy transducer TonB [Dysgonamonadaceae bacterium]